MSVTRFALLIDKGRFDHEVMIELQSAREGQVGHALATLRSHLSRGIDDLDVPPSRYFGRTIELAVDVLERKRTTAFVNEMAPVIAEPTKAWKHNVNTLVRAGLVLSLCTVRPTPEFAPIVCYAFRMVFLVEECSNTAREVFSGGDSDKLEPVLAGIFESGEWIVSRDACGLIADDTRRLVRERSWSGEDAEVLEKVRHLEAIFDRAHSEKHLAVLVGHR